MLPEKRTNTNVGVGVGVLLQLVGLFVLANNGDAKALVGLLLIVVSLVPFIWGCMNYAEGKGHAKQLGLVGVAGIIGLIVLIVLPDRHPVLPSNRNPCARTAYYLAVLSLIPILGLPLGMAAFVLGIVGLVYASKHEDAHGRAAAWTGIILGGICATLWILLVPPFFGFGDNPIVRWIFNSLF